MIIAEKGNHMDRDEAWAFTIERALTPRWRGHIEACLKECNGNVKEAVKLSRASCTGIWMNSWGVYGHRGLGIDTNMMNRNAGIYVWLHGRRWPDRHDFTIPWEDVFRYVQEGAQQLSLL